MEAGQYIRTLAEFVAGEIELPKFKQFVEERLFELRQDSEMTNDEKRFLSSIELYLHEAEERLRDRSEVYAHIQSILDNVILPTLTSKGETKSLPPVVPKTPYLLSKTFDVEPKPSNKEQTETRDLPLVAAK